MRYSGGMVFPLADPLNPVLRPLVLGANGRIGTGFQHIAQAGLWPGSAPLWQVRPGAHRPAGDVFEWDILRSPPPALPPCSGIICLAGVVAGPVGLNTDLALAAIDLALRAGCGPVLLTSTAAVYGRSAGPVDEDAPCDPVSDYGRAKLAMEAAVSARLRDLGPAAPPVCILRIGNVAGADVLLLAAQQGRVTLDQFDGGGGPVRSYIGMQTLAQVMLRVIDLATIGTPLPPVLNVAAPAPVAMANLLKAAGLGWDWQAAPNTALARMTLDTGRLAALLPLDPDAATAAELIRQARLAGWSASR
jgi:nucleoside-diphosphate-sugar epimerase